MWKMQPEYLDSEKGNGGGGAAVPLGSAAVSGDIPAPDVGAEPPQGVDWESFADDPPGTPAPADVREGDELESDEPVVVAPTAPAAPPAVPATQPQPAVQQPPQAQAPQAQQPTPEQLAQQAAEARGRVRDELANIYTSELDEDTKAALLADPASVMPKLLSQAAMDGAQLAIRHIQEILPQAVAQFSGVREGVSKAWGEFDAAHPDLAKPEYRQVVQTSIHALKASGQKLASKEDAMAAVARVARSMLGLPAPGTPAAVQVPASAPVAPHTPVARGRARPAAPATAKANPWDEFLD